MKTATVRSIALSCGVSRTTAALALKNSSLVSPTTRLLVQKEAQSCGYKADAQITKLMTYLRKGQFNRSLCNLAWINGSERKNEWSAVLWSKELFHGAQERALELGYAIDEIWLRDPNFNPSKMNTLLRARGVEGLLLPQMFQSVAVKYPWKNLHSVILLEPRAEPCMHRVNFDANYNIQLALTELIHLGYTRPALAVEHYSDSRSGFAYSAQMMIDHLEFFSHKLLKPYWGGLGEKSQEVFLKWFKKERPDVLLVCNNEWISFLKKLNIQVPKDLGLCHLEASLDVSDWAGVNPRRRLVGAAAVDILTSHLSRGEKGSPPYPKEVLIKGIWQTGKTVQK